MRDDEVDENVTVINYKEGVAERIIKHVER